MSAAGALIDMAAEGSGATARDGPQDLEVSPCSRIAPAASSSPPRPRHAAMTVNETIGKTRGLKVIGHQEPAGTNCPFAFDPSGRRNSASSC